MCPQCGYVLEDFAELNYEDKLLAALNHSVSERRIMAAQILGNLNSQRAVPAFMQIIRSDEDNYFVLRAVVLAIARINHPDRICLLEEAAHHPSALVAKLARELIEQLREQTQLKEWDQHPG